jgi:hypothetical protein
MPSGSGLIHSSRASRAIYLVSALLVFFNILFDVLDLDGSDFLRLLVPTNRTITVAVVPSGAEIDYSFHHSELRDGIALLFADRSELNLRPPQAEVLISSALGRARFHKYRVGLARNSLPN